MTGTSLNLGGNADEFLGGYLKNIGSSLGLSISPSTANITIYEDALEGKFFQPVDVGSYTTVSAGSNWSFGGVLTKYEVDVRNIGGRGIRITLADPREIMKSIPVILAPGYQTIADTIKDTECSLIDVYGALNSEGINLSGWNQAGMPYSNFEKAINGGNIVYIDAEIPIEQQTGKAFGETYQFDISELTDKVDPDYRINTNLVAISNVIQDLANQHAFDWFVTSERLASGVIKVVIKTIDRSQDNIDVSLPEFLAQHEDKVITATSGVELRNEVACSVLQGALVEQMTKVNILGMANEPIDLSAESGYNAYNMEEDEIRAVLAGRQTWEMWLGEQRDLIDVEGVDAQVGTGGFSRYGGILEDLDTHEVLRLATLSKKKIANLPKNKLRRNAQIVSDKGKLVGRIFTKLQNHAKTTYGKRFVHDAILDDIIQSAWTRDVVAKGDSGGALKNADPNEYFRQKDGRTRAYVEYSLDAEGGAFSLGLANLTQLFGDQNIFQNVTRFGTTFENRSSADDSILVLELANEFNPFDVNIDIKDTANYVYKDSSSLISSVKTSLYVACTVDSDGVISLPGGVFQSAPTKTELVNRALANAIKIGGKKDKNGEDTATVEQIKELLPKIYRFYGRSMFEMHAKSFQPDFAYIPTRSKFARYGPVFSQQINDSAQGKVNIIQDDGFSPWEFGSVSSMIAAMQLKVNNAGSVQKEAFSANIQVEGYPLYSVGDSLEKNANINSLSMSFGDGGVKTSYSLQTYTRKFGEMSKEDWARVAYILSNNSGGSPIQQKSSYATNYNVDVVKQFTARFGNSSDNLNGGAFNYG